MADNAVFKLHDHRNVPKATTFFDAINHCFFWLLHPYINLFFPLLGFYVVFCCFLLTVSRHVFRVSLYAQDTFHVRENVFVTPQHSWTSLF